MIGRIYKIIHNQSNICYIGSTFNELKQRWKGHKQSYYNWIKTNNINYKLSIYPYFKEFGINNFKMILVKEYEICDRKHLTVFETLWMVKLKGINTQYPFNLCSVKSHSAAYNKKYKEQNKERLIEYRKINKDKRNKQNKEWREKNKDKIQQKYTCECLKTISCKNKNVHNKSKYHINYLNSLKS